MIDSGVSFFSVFSVFFIISLGVIIILWIQMPFSAFKSRELLEEIKKEQEKTNQLLAQLAKGQDTEPLEKADSEISSTETTNN